MTADYDFYVALEPNHEVEVDDEGYQLVRCPFVDAVTPWSPSANPEEVNCLFCEWLHDPVELPPCPEEGDADPQVAGGAHGGTHTWSEYAPCKVPLRRIACFGVTMAVHEGIVGDCFEAERRWRKLGGPAFYKIEQHHTGSYACRNSVAHSRAIAIDFNWQRQPMVSKRTPCPADPQMPEFYAKCWQPLGYGSGLYWRSKCDGMHVSKLPNEGGDGVLYRTWKDDEEDELTEEQAQMLEDSYNALFTWPEGKGKDKPRIEHLNVIGNMLHAIGGELKIKFGPDGKKVS